MTAHLIDGMAMVQRVRTCGVETFGKLSKRLYMVATSQLGHNGCNRVDVIFDRYDKPMPIKESDRERRGES